MSFTRKLQTKVSVTVCAAMLCFLACGASVVEAEGIVPVEGGWVATTSVGLPVSFEVKEGNVLNAHFRFNWGFCGTYESHLPNTNPIDANGHWSFEDPRGQTVEATFVAPTGPKARWSRSNASSRAALTPGPPSSPRPAKCRTSRDRCSRCRTRTPVTSPGARAKSCSASTAPSPSMGSGGRASAAPRPTRRGRLKSIGANTNGTRGLRCGSAS